MSTYCRSSNSNSSSSTRGITYHPHHLAVCRIRARREGTQSSCLLLLCSSSDRKENCITKIGCLCLSREPKRNNCRGVLAYGTYVRHVSVAALQYGSKFCPKPNDTRIPITSRCSMSCCHRVLRYSQSVDVLPRSTSNLA